MLGGIGNFRFWDDKDDRRRPEGDQLKRLQKLVEESAAPYRGQTAAENLAEVEKRGRQGLIFGSPQQQQPENTRRTINPDTGTYVMPEKTRATPSGDFAFTPNRGAGGRIIQPNKENNTAGGVLTPIPARKTDEISPSVPPRGNFPDTGEYSGRTGKQMPYKMVGVYRPDKEPVPTKDFFSETQAKYPTQRDPRMEKALRDVRKETLQQKTDLKPQEELIKRYANWDYGPSTAEGRQVGPAETRSQQLKSAMPELSGEGVNYLLDNQRVIQDPSTRPEGVLARLGRSGEIGPESGVATSYDDPEGKYLRADSEKFKEVPTVQMVQDYDQLAKIGVAPNDKLKQSRTAVGPYVVPALMAPAGEFYDLQTQTIEPLGSTPEETRRQKMMVAEGTGVRQPSTYTVGQKGTRRFNPTAVRLELLDPSARLPIDIAEKYGLSYFVPDRTSGRPQSQAQTLGEAINAIIRGNLAPVVSIPSSNLDVRAGKYENSPNQFFLNDERVIPLGRGQSDGETTVRLGTSRITNQGYLTINNLLEDITGMQLVSNFKLQDPILGDMQKRLMQVTKPAKQYQKGKPMVTITGNPLQDLLDQLQEGRDIDRMLGSAERVNFSPLATDRFPLERDAFRDKMGLKERMLQIVRDARAAGAPNLYTPEAQNAPVNPSPDANINRKPSVSQANVPAGMRPTTNEYVDLVRQAKVDELLNKYSDMDFVQKLRRIRGR
tara:strand:+ start:21336 stop:23489 length:2154 start_codon:yes stop_codon:yes gene_type:complete